MATKKQSKRTPAKQIKSAAKKKAPAKQVKSAAKKKAPAKPVAKKTSAAKKTPVQMKTGKKPAKKTAPVKKTVKAKKAVPAKKAAVKAAPKKKAQLKKSPVNKPAAKKPAKKAAGKFQLPENKTKPIRGPVAISVDKPKPFPKAPAKKLSASELKDLRASLVAARSRLDGLVRGLRNESLVRHDEVNHEEDGTDAFIRLSGLDRATTEQRRIVMIDEALRAIDAGTYGLCEQCGNRIEYLRLQALPFAKTCIRCQSAAENGPRGKIPARQKLWK